MQIRKILVVALFISFPIFILFLFKNEASLEVLDILSNPKVYWAFLLSTIILLTAHLIRAYKTKYLVDTIKPTNYTTHNRALFIGYLFNTLLPFRIGEFIRAFVLGKGLKMSSTFMFGLVVFDRAIDGLLLASFSLALLYWTDIFSESQLDKVVFGASLTILIVSATLLILIFVFRKQPKSLLLLVHRTTGLFRDDVRDSLRFKIWSLMYGLERVLLAKRVIVYICISIVMWGVYLGALFPLSKAILQSPTKNDYVGASTISYLGVSAPSGPAYIGSYGSFVRPYIDAKPDTEEVKALLSATWLLLVLPAFVVGLVFILTTKESTKGPRRVSGLNSTDDKLLRNVDISHDLGSFLDAFFSNNSLSRIMHKLEVNKDSRLIQYFKGGSSAITALVYENDKYVVRKITPIQYKYKLKSQYDWLKNKAKLEKIVNVISEESGADYYKIDLEYNEKYITFFDHIHSMPVDKSKVILEEIYKYLFDNVYTVSKPKYRSKDLDLYIEDRCLAKIRQASEVNDEIRSLLSYETIIINGKIYTNLLQIIEQIKSDKYLCKKLATYSKCSIHGDVTIDNIIVNKDSGDFLLIDPTDNENEISGPVFDFGRTTQSLGYGYEFLCRDNTQVIPSGNKISFEHSISSQYKELHEHLLKIQKTHLSTGEFESVGFHAGILFSRMLTHRVVINPLNAVKFYAISVIAFNEFWEKNAKPE